MKSASRISAGTGGKELWPKQNKPLPPGALTQIKVDPVEGSWCGDCGGEGAGEAGRAVSVGAGQPLVGAALG